MSQFAIPRGPLWGLDGQGLVETSAAEEVPKVFSTKSQTPFAGGAGGLSAFADRAYQEPSFGSSWAGPAGLPTHGDPCWVTVFGFSGRSAALVRQQLESFCGPIVEVCHGDGNFMHVRFRSAAAANTCLSLNGHAILGKLLVGCVPCTANLGAMRGPQGLGAEEGPRLAAVQDEPKGLFGPGQRGATTAAQVHRAGFGWRLLDLLFDL